MFPVCGVVEAHPGARASRPHKSSRSFGHLLHRNQPAAAPCLCFGRAHAVPADRAVGCNIAGKLSGNRRDSMRAGRPRSRGCRPDGEVGGIRRATSLKAGLSPLGNSRLPASRAPAPRDWADPSRSYESETGVFQALVVNSGNTSQPSPTPVFSILTMNWFCVTRTQVCFRQVSPPPCRADHTRVKQSEIDNPVVTLVSRRG